MTDDKPLDSRLMMQIRLAQWAIYSEAREKFYATIQRLSTLIGILSGTALVATARSNTPEFSLIFGFFVSFLSGIVLVFDFPGLARRHRESRVKAMALMEELERDQSPTAPDRIEALYKQTFAFEPLCFHAISTQALNAAQAHYDRKARVKISKWQLLIGHIWPFSPTTFQEFVNDADPPRPSTPRA